jgi:hypothetical protein
MNATSTPLRGLRRLAVLLPLLALAACMNSPHHWQVFPSRNTAIPFNGYVDVPGAPVNVYVQAWSNPAACGYDTTPSWWQLLATTTSSTTPVYDQQGAAWYSWQLTSAIPSANWCLKPGPQLGGLSYSTNVYGRYRYFASQLGTKWRNLYTVEQSWMTCAQQQGGSGFSIVANCTRKGENSHAAQIWALQ